MLPMLKMRGKISKDKERFSVGLDIGTSSVKVVKLKFFKETAELCSLGLEPIQLDLENLLKKAEAYSTNNYLVKAKWSKIFSHGKRKYSQCYGPPFIMQFSGSGLVAPCGMLFNERFKKFHIGNIADASFKEIWQSKRYWEVIGFLASKKFDARTMCGSLCLQHKVNEFLWDLKKGKAAFKKPNGKTPMHINFI